VQLAPALSVAAHVLLASRNPGGIVSARLVSADVPVLLIVTEVALVIVPTAVSGKVIVFGVTAMPAAIPPAPLSGTGTGVTFRVDEEIVSVAVIPPVATGVKIT
jgi:hypothetical protein